MRATLNSVVGWKEVGDVGMAGMKPDLKVTTPKLILVTADAEVIHFLTSHDTPVTTNTLF